MVWKSGGMDLESEISRGESNRLEFKKELPKDHRKYLKTVVAFSNCSGGRILFGVSDDRSIVGIPDDILFSTVDSITNSIVDSCTPAIVQNIYVETIGESNIIVVDVSPGVVTPYYLVSEGRRKGTYVRVNGTSVVADPDTLRSLELRGQRLSFDVLPNPTLPITGERIQSLCTRLSSYGTEVTPMKLVNMGVLQETVDGYMATNAFAMFTSNPFPHSRIQCARFSDSKGLVFADSRDMEGDLIDQVAGAMEFITRNLSMSSEINGLKRRDRYEIAPEALREAVVNAVVHRDYVMSSESITIRIFDDRVEVESPGLPLGFDVSDPASGRSKIRNQAIASIFKVIGFIERYGTGIPRMMDSCATNGNEPPVFSEDGQRFRVTFTRRTARKVPNGSRVDAILAAIESDPSLTQKALSESTGIPVGSVKRILTELREEGIITRRGSDRKGEWIVKRGPE